MADDDGNGELSWDEIYYLCENNLKKFIGKKDNAFLKQMSYFFTKFIFQTFGIEVLDDKDDMEEIPLSMIKDYILKVPRTPKIIKFKFR